MKSYMKGWIPALAFVALVAVSVTGCDAGDTSETYNGTVPFKGEAPAAAAEAGLEAKVDARPENQPMELAKKKYFPVRGDAFALNSTERAFDRAQLAARLVSDSGGFSNMFSVPDEAADLPPVSEPLPLWRLSGVVISDGVAALLETGTRTIEIRPGMKIPDTDWTVVSIDANRAVLKRSGNKLPKTFVVELKGSFSSGTPGGGGGGGGGGSTGGGGAAGGKKGGPAGGPGQAGGD